jgi:hypothetical protein
MLHALRGFQTPFGAFRSPFSGLVFRSGGGFQPPMTALKLLPFSDKRVEAFQHILQDFGLHIAHVRNTEGLALD